MAEPLHYGSISVDCALQSGRYVRLGFSDVTVHLLMANGVPFASGEFSGDSPDKVFSDESETLIANAGEGIIHNLSAYSFIRVALLLRGVPDNSIDGVVERLKEEISAKLDSKDAYLQFYAHFNIPPPEGFDALLNR